MASLKKRRTAAGELRYDVRYRTVAGDVRTRTFRGRRDAERFMATVEADKLRGDWVDPRLAKQSFADVARDWSSSNPRKRLSTVATESSYLKMHILPVFASRPIGRITRKEVQNAVNKWAETLSPRTVRRVFETFNAILNYASLSDIIVRVPTRGVKLPQVRKLDRPLPSPERIAQLAAALEPDFGAFVYLGAVLGLRWGECAGLRVGRIDFVNSTLMVAEQITRGRGGEPIAGPPKSEAGIRTLAMPTPLAEMLASHLMRQGLSEADEDEYVFTMPDGGPLWYQNWRIRFWLPACKEVGLAGLGFHDLRRMNATGLVAGGIDVKTVQARLGHSDPRLTLAIYAQATTEADRAAADLLGARLMPRAERGKGAGTRDVNR
jgi:integrase